MDRRFQPALSAIESGDAQRLRQLLEQDPTLATSRSSTSHPTLLQGLVLSSKGSPVQIEMAKTLIDAGAPLDEPLVAAASVDNADAAALLLDAGAAINGNGGWAPLEEALYWNSTHVIELLLARGATIHNLRIASGLGRADLIAAFFTADGTLKPNAGSVNWPWGDLAEKFASFAQDQQGIVDNAFVYACMHGHLDAAKLLLRHGAQINAIPGGFDYSGTALHYAAYNGHMPMVEFLLGHGADPAIKDTKIGVTAADWAEHSGKDDVRAVLESKAQSL